jgi:hypothetical protein
MKNFSVYLLISSLCLFPLLAADDSKDTAPTTPSSVDPNQIKVKTKDPELNDVLNVMRENEYGKIGIAEGLTKKDKAGIDAFGFDHHNKNEHAIAKHAQKLYSESYDKLSTNDLLTQAQKGHSQAIFILLERVKKDDDRDQILTSLYQIIKKPVGQHFGKVATALYSFYKDNPEILKEWDSKNERWIGRESRVAKWAMIEDKEEDKRVKSEARQKYILEEILKKTPKRH